MRLNGVPTTSRNDYSLDDNPHLQDLRIFFRAVRILPREIVLDRITASYGEGRKKGKGGREAF